MRAFLALDLDEKLKGKISEVQRQIAESNAPIKFVEPENLHFTFKFFGEISPEKAQNIRGIMEKKIKDYRPFEIFIKGVGVFPNLGYIRVIWLGVEDPGNFSQMQKGFDEEFVKMGFKKERSYTPHLTMGRVKGAKNKDELVSILKELQNLEIGRMDVKQIVMKKSELTPAGPIYTNIGEFEL